MSADGTMPTGLSAVSDFVLDEPEIPESALRMASVLLLDTLGVAAGAVPLKAGRIARETAAACMAAPEGGGVAMLFDGRRASLPGACFAAATQIDNLDAHDGFNPVKGHVGCAVVPALVALAPAGLAGRDALRALVIAYEVAARAGMALHATVADYHTSGAWNALGVAALACRFAGGSPETLAHALGIAEYHGPRSQMMREIATPTMLHDGSGMGALVGTMAADMAMRGFEGAPAITVTGPEAAAHWSDLGARWTIEETYIKPYPICRWAHAAIDAAGAILAEHGLSPADIASVEVATFANAARLFPGMPRTTSEAQYSLGFAVATMLVHGRIGPEHIAGTALADPEVAALIDRISVREEPRHEARFPAGRWSDVTIRTADGRLLASGDMPARGGVEAPMRLAEIRSKFDRFAGVSLTQARTAAIWAAGEALLEDAPFDALAELVTAPADIG